MRHRKGGKKLNRTSAHRKALNRNLTRSLILHGRIKTTVPKAKEMVPFASRLVTLAKDGSLAARRRAIEIMGEDEAVGRLFTEIAPKFRDRPGGYLRITRMPFPRLGDKAPLAYVEFVEEEVLETEDSGKKKKGKQKKLSRKAKREQAKKERKKYDLKKRIESTREEEEAEESESTEEESTEEEATAEEATTEEAAVEEVVENEEREKPEETEEPAQPIETEQPEQPQEPGQDDTKTGNESKE